MGGDKEKKLKAVEVEEENNGTLIDGELVLSIEKLQEIQDELEKINEEASEKVLEVERKFNEIRKPAYDKRNEIIKAIPDFWLTAFISHPALSELLTDEDQKIFKYLNNLEVEDSKDVKSGYSIAFNFNPNPYFEDTKVSKTFEFLEGGSQKSPQHQLSGKKERAFLLLLLKRRKETSELLLRESFFTWFSDSEQKGDIFEIHDEVADIIKEDLWPNPLTYFNNDADEELEEDDDEENNVTEDDDDEEDDDEEDED